MKNYRKKAAKIEFEREKYIIEYYDKALNIKCKSIVNAKVLGECLADYETREFMQILSISICQM